MSWKAAVQLDDTGEWLYNSLRFKTEAEAREYSFDCAIKGRNVRSTRVTETADPVTHSFINGQLKCGHNDEPTQDLLDE